MPSKSKVYFYRQDVKIRLPNARSLKAMVERLFRLEGRKLGRMSYIFCSDDTLRKINQQYLGHDYYTDIVTFRLSDKDAPVEGESYISIDRVRENSKELTKPVSEELMRVIFHGALHLCGYLDKNRKDAMTMRKREDFYLDKM